MGGGVVAGVGKNGRTARGGVKDRDLIWPGSLCSTTDVPCYFLPGVPNEMKHLLEKNVIPDLETRFPERCTYLKHIVRVQGLLEVQVNKRLRAFDPDREGVDIGYYPQGRENWVSIFASAPNEEVCRALVKSAEEKIIALDRRPPHKRPSMTTASKK